MSKHIGLQIAIVILILLLTIMLLASSSVTANSGSGDWAMFRHDPTHSGVGNSDSSNGAVLLWNYTTGGSVWSSPAVTDGCVYVGSKDGYIYCLNSSTGRLVWSLPTGGEVDSSPAVDGERLFVGSDDGWFYCLNCTTGVPMWVQWVGWNGGWHSRPSPTVADGKVFVGSGDHDLLCFNEQDGSIVWNFSTEDPVMSTPAVSNGTLYFATDDQHVYAVDMSSGKELWRTLTGSAASSPCLNNGCLFIGSSQGTLFCLNASNGAIVWGFQTGDMITSSPAVDNGCVYVGSEDNNIYCVNASNGQMLWQTKTGFWVCSSPAVAGGNVYVGSEDFNLYCLNASSGAVEWSYQTGNYVDSSPAIVNGKLYFGSHDHNVYAFALFNSTSTNLADKQSQFPPTTLVFDAIVCAAGALVVFAVAKAWKSSRSNAVTLDKGRRNWVLRHVDALCVLCIAVFSVSFFLSIGNGFLWVADEQTYSQMTFHMLKTGDYLSPSAYGELALWTGKPPLLMWLTSVAYQIFGIDNFASRFWVAVFAALALLAVFFLGKKFYNRWVGLLSAFVLGTFTTFYSFATHLMMDVPLVFFMLSSLYFLFSSENSKKTVLYAALSGLFFGLALLTKQVGALLIPAVAIVYLGLANRNLKFLFTKRFALFLGVALAVFSPWLVYMGVRFGSGFWDNYFFYSTYSRIVTPIEGHVGGLLYYFEYLVSSENLLWVALLPFAVGLSVYFAAKRSKGNILILTWIVIVLCVFSVAQTKLYYYILPAYPAFAIAISSMLYSLARRVQLKLWKKPDDRKNLSHTENDSHLIYTNI